MQQFPIMNVLYADQAGNIFYLYNGLIPRRDPQFDWSKPVDGSNPQTTWNGMHPIDDLPQLFNPPAGYVQNCNSSPFTTCDAGNPKPRSFPPYMVEDGNDDKRRAKMSRQLLREMKGATFEDVRTGRVRHHGVLGARTIARVSAADLKSLKSRIPSWPPRSSRTCSTCSIGTTESRPTRPRPRCARPGTRSCTVGSTRPRRCCRNSSKNPKLEFEALVSVAERLKSRHGDWRIAWGKLFRVQRRPEMIDLLGLTFDDRLPSLPSSGAPGPMGVVFTQYYSPSIRIPFVLSLNERYGLVAPATWPSTSSAPRFAARAR